MHHPSLDNAPRILMPFAPSTCCTADPLSTRRAYPPGLEHVKWLALLCMTVDHVNHFAFRGANHWMYEVGRLAIPLFSLTFGIGLAYLGDWKRSLARLLAFALLAQFAWFATDKTDFPNILFTFALAAVLVQSYARLPVPAVLLALVLGAVVEGTYGALSLAVGAYCLERGNVMLGWCLLVVGSVVTCLLSHSLVPALGLPVLCLVRTLPIPPTRRVPSFFYWYYPAHILLLGLIGSKL